MFVFASAAADEMLTISKIFSAPSTSVSGAQWQNRLTKFGARSRLYSCAWVMAVAFAVERVIVRAKNYNQHQHIFCCAPWIHIALKL
jgi:hypothetical protein